MKRILIITVLFGLCSQAFAQLLPHLGWANETEIFYNPGAVGVKDEPRATVLTRNQWNGITGSPKTNVVAVDLPIGKGMSAGGTISTDKIGGTSENKVSLDGSYRVYLSPKTFFQGGLKATFSHITSGFLDLSQWDSGDPVKEDVSAFVPRIGFGFTYAHPRFTAGIGLPDFVSFDLQDAFSASQDNKYIRRNIFFSAGTKVTISEYVNVIPNVWVRYYQGRTYNYTLNVGLELNQTVVVGGSYVRPGIGAVFGKVAITPRIKFGYRHEFSPVVFNVGGIGTGEFLLTYGFQ